MAEWWESEDAWRALEEQDPGFTDWAHRYAREHGHYPGGGNRESLEQAISNREWSQEFAATQGGPPGPQDWKTHYYRPEEAKLPDYGQHWPAAVGMVSKAFQPDEYKAPGLSGIGDDQFQGWPGQAPGQTNVSPVTTGATGATGATDWEALLRQEAEAQGLGEYYPVLRAIVDWEHRDNPNATAVNPDTMATGLMQVMPSDVSDRYGGMFDDRPTSEELLDPAINIREGVSDFKRKLDAAGGDVTQALTNYSGGYSVEQYAAPVLARAEQYRTTAPPVEQPQPPLAASGSGRAVPPPGYDQPPDIGTYRLSQDAAGEAPPPTFADPVQQITYNVLSTITKTLNQAMAPFEQGVGNYNQMVERIQQAATPQPVGYAEALNRMRQVPEPPTPGPVQRTLDESPDPRLRALGQAWPHMGTALGMLGGTLLEGAKLAADTSLNYVLPTLFPVQTMGLEAGNQLANDLREVISSGLPFTIPKILTPSTDEALQYIDEPAMLVEQTLGALALLTMPQEIKARAAELERRRQRVLELRAQGLEQSVEYRQAEWEYQQMQQAERQRTMQALQGDYAGATGVAPSVGDGLSQLAGTSTEDLQAAWEFGRAGLYTGPGLPALAWIRARQQDKAEWEETIQDVARFQNLWMEGLGRTLLDPIDYAGVPVRVVWKAWNNARIAERWVKPFSLNADDAAEAIKTANLNRSTWQRIVPGYTVQARRSAALTSTDFVTQLVMMDAADPEEMIARLARFVADPDRFLLENGLRHSRGMVEGAGVLRRVAGVPQQARKIERLTKQLDALDLADRRLAQATAAELQRATKVVPERGFANYLDNALEEGRKQGLAGRELQEFILEKSNERIGQVLDELVPDSSANYLERFLGPITGSKVYQGIMNTLVMGHMGLNPSWLARNLTVDNTVRLIDGYSPFMTHRRAMHLVDELGLEPRGVRSPAPVKTQVVGGRGSRDKALMGVQARVERYGGEVVYAQSATNTYYEAQRRAAQGFLSPDLKNALTPDQYRYLASELPYAKNRQEARDIVGRLFREEVDLRRAFDPETMQEAQELGTEAVLRQLQKATSPEARARVLERRLKDVDEWVDADPLKGLTPRDSDNGRQASRLAAEAPEAVDPTVMSAEQLQQLQQELAVPDPPAAARQATQRVRQATGAPSKNRISWWYLHETERAPRLHTAQNATMDAIEQMKATDPQRANELHQAFLSTRHTNTERFATARVEGDKLAEAGDFEGKSLLWNEAFMDNTLDMEDLYRQVTGKEFQFDADAYRRLLRQSGGEPDLPPAAAPAPPKPAPAPQVQRAPEPEVAPASLSADDLSPEQIAALPDNVQVFPTGGHEGAPTPAERAREVALIERRARLEGYDLDDAYIVHPQTQAAADRLPPVPEGHVRLWRGGASRAEVPADPRGIDETMRGRWFAEDLSEAQWYADHQFYGATTVPLYYLDLPVDEANRFRVSVGGDWDALEFSRNPRHEFYLPSDVAERAQRAMPDMPKTDRAESTFPSRATSTPASERAREVVETVGEPAAEMAAEQLQEPQTPPLPRASQATLNELRSVAREAGIDNDAYLLNALRKELDLPTDKPLARLQDWTDEELQRATEAMRERAQRNAAEQATIAAEAPRQVVDSIPVSDIQVDPARFQFKLGASEQGTTGALSDVQKWDPNLASGVQLWRDPADGQVYVVNGHHRVALAKRLGVEDMPGVYFIEADTAEAARAAGALKNISEGRGTPIDAAKFFRDSGLSADDLAERGVSMRESLVAQGAALANLNDLLFTSVVRGEFPTNWAIVIGQKLPDHNAQTSLLRLLEKDRRNINEAVLSELIDLVQGAPSTGATQATLFGMEAIQQTNAVEKAEVMAYVRQELSRDRRLFGTVAGQADRLQTAGNVIDVAQSRGVSQEAAQLLDLWDVTKTQQGEISDILNAAARRIAGGENARKVQQEAYEQIREALPRVIRGTEGPSGAGVPQGSLFGATEAPGRPTAVGPTTPQRGAGQQVARAEPREVTPTLLQQARQQHQRGRLSVHDVYAETNQPRILKGTDARGEEIWGYDYMPDLFYRSDATGRPIRFYVELENGARVHPDELDRLVRNAQGEWVLPAKESIYVEVPGSRRRTVSSASDAVYEAINRNLAPDDIVTLRFGELSLSKTKAEWNAAIQGMRSRYGSDLKRLDSFQTLYDELAEAAPTPDLARRTPGQQGLTGFLSGERGSLLLNDSATRRARAEAGIAAMEQRGLRFEPWGQSQLTGSSNAWIAPDGRVLKPQYYHKEADIVDAYKEAIGFNHGSPASQMLDDGWIRLKEAVGAEIGTTDPTTISRLEEIIDNHFRSYNTPFRIDLAGHQRIRRTTVRVGAADWRAGTVDLAETIRKADSPVGKLGSLLKGERGSLNLPTRKEMGEQIKGFLRRAADSLSGKKAPAKLPPLSPEAKKLLRGERWRQFEEAINLNKTVAAQAGARARDFAFHNYDAKTSADQLAALLLMYPFWASRTYPKMAMRILQHPSILAGYLRYKRALEDHNKGLPEWYRNQLRLTQDLVPWLPKEFLFNIEAMLNPAYNLTTQFERPGQDDSPFGWIMEQADKYGFSPHMWMIAAYAADKYMSGKPAEAQAALGYPAPVLRTFRDVTAMMGINGGKGLEIVPWNWWGGLSKPGIGGDYWTRRRVAANVGYMTMNGDITPEEAREAAIALARGDMENDALSEAMKREAQERAPSNLIGFLFGAGLKPRSESEAQLEKDYATLNQIYADATEMTPEEFAEALNQFYRERPYMRFVSMGRSELDKAETSYLYDIFFSMPPGQRDTVYERYGDEQMQGIVNKALDAKDVSVLDDEERIRLNMFLAAMSPQYPPPEPGMAEEWRAVSKAYSAMEDEADRKFGGAIGFTEAQNMMRDPERGTDFRRLLQEYYEADPETRAAMRDQYPQINEYFDWKEQYMRDDPLLMWYYGPPPREQATSTIWDMWYALEDKPQSREDLKSDFDQLAVDMGVEGCGLEEGSRCFTDFFLNKETREIEGLPNELLLAWTLGLAAAGAVVGVDTDLYRTAEAEAPGQQRVAPADPYVTQPYQMGAEPGAATDEPGGTGLVVPPDVPGAGRAPGGTGDLGAGAGEVAAPEAGGTARPVSEPDAGGDWSFELADPEVDALRLERNRLYKLCDQGVQEACQALTDDRFDVFSSPEWQKYYGEIAPGWRTNDSGFYDDPLIKRWMDPDTRDSVDPDDVARRMDELKAALPDITFGDPAEYEQARDEQAQWKEASQGLMPGTMAYRQAQQQFAQEHPIWAKYYLRPQTASSLADYAARDWTYAPSGGGGGSGRSGGGGGGTSGGASYRYPGPWFSPDYYREPQLDNVRASPTRSDLWRQVVASALGRAGQR